MPFGLKNASPTFQRLMDEIFGDLSFVFCFLDDILVFSKDAEEHKVHLRIVLERLQAHGLVLNLKKCIFGVPEIDFLGYRVNAQGLSPLPERVAAIHEFPLPTTAEELSRYLGMLNFYHRFLPHIAEVLAPLHALLAEPNPDKKEKKKKQRKKSTNTKQNKKRPLTWTTEAKTAFESSKDALTDAAILAHPKNDAPLVLVTDASDVALGAVAQQEVNSVWEPLLFGSRKLTNTERNYSPYDRELLAIFWAIKKFRHLLEGRQFVIFTDHKPLTYAFTKNRTDCSPRQMHQLQFIAEYTTDIRYIAGKENIVADALSRITAVTAPQPFVERLALAQQDDDELQKLVQSPSNTGLTLEQFPVENSQLNVWCDTNRAKERPFVPEPLRREVFDRIHGMAHPGAKTTAKLISERFVWPRLKVQCKEWARTCVPCQTSKVTRHTQAPLQNFPPTTERFSVVHIDLIGPLPVSEGKRYCLTMIDRLSRWPEVVPLVGITSEEVIRAFKDCWLSRYGVPKTVVTDRGRQFISDNFRQLARNVGFEIHFTNAYHPQANGMIERFHRTLKAALMCKDSCWTEALAPVLLGLRAALKEDLGASPAELLYGEPLRLPGEFFVAPATKSTTAEMLTHLQAFAAELSPLPAAHHGEKSFFVYPELAIATHVFLRTDAVMPSLTKPFTGPYKVIQRSSKSFVILVKGKERTVSIDRLKPAFVLASKEPAAIRAPVIIDLPRPAPEPGQPDQRENPEPAPPAEPAPLVEPAAQMLIPPAPAEAQQAPPEQPEVRTTRSGRRVHFPAKLQEYWTSGLERGAPCGALDPQI